MVFSLKHFSVCILHFTNGHWLITNFLFSYFQILIFKSFTFQLQFRFKVILTFSICSLLFPLLIYVKAYLQTILDSYLTLISNLKFSIGVLQGFIILVSLSPYDLITQHSHHLDFIPLIHHFESN